MCCSDLVSRSNDGRPSSVYPNDAGLKDGPAPANSCSTLGLDEATRVGGPARVGVTLAGANAAAAFGTIAIF